MGRMDGKVALITGAARGQGRSHAVRLAEEGAQIVAVDICAQIETAAYQLSTTDDLEQTVKLVEDLDRRIIARTADVRDVAALRRVVEDGVAEFGHIDVVCANAGIASFVPALQIDQQTWDDVIDVNLTGVWKTIQAALPQMVERGRGGTIIITSSVAGLMGFPNLVHYSAAKHGVVGMMRVLAQELAPHNIRVNTVNPTTVDTPMCMNEAFFRLARPDLEDPTADDTAEAMRGLNTLPIPWSTRSTSATPCCGLPPTRPGTSPASRCPLTPGSAKRLAERPSSCRNEQTRRTWPGSHARLPRRRTSSNSVGSATADRGCRRPPRPGNVD